MKNMFSLTPVWSEEQLEVLNSEPNLIVRGFAGSGKTLLAIHIGIKRAIEYKERVLIVVFTKTLARVIENYLEKLNLGHNKLTVVFHGKLQYSPLSLIKPDVLIVDEFQDFTQQDLVEFLKNTKKNYFIGDDDQSLYDYQYNSGRRTLSQDDIVNKTKFPVLYLTKNLRSGKGLELLAQQIFWANNESKEVGILENYYAKCMMGLNPDDNNGNKFLNCFITSFNDNEEVDETVWLYDSLKEYKKNFPDETIAVLVMDNDRVRQLHEIFQQHRLSHGYKIENELSSNFLKEDITLMTYHSAKGLEFAHVFLPYSNKLLNEKSFWQRAYFTAITRAVKSINLTFSRSSDYQCEFRLQWLLDKYPTFNYQRI